MSSSDCEQGVAFQVAIGRSPVEALTQPPELPRHLRIRLQNYASTRPRKNLNDRMEAAERRRQRNIQRRLENAREADERCRRLVEAVEIVTDYRRHLDGKATNGRPPKRSEVKAVYANIKEDLQAVLGRVDRETRRMVDNEYVHEPLTYRPQRRVSHTDSCTCECCYLEDEAKKEAVKKDLGQIIAEMSSPEAMSGDFEREDFSMDLENVDPQQQHQEAELQVSFEVRSSAPIGIRSRGRKRVTWVDDSTEDDDEDGRRSQGCHAALNAGPDMAIHVFCHQCNSFTNMSHVGRAVQVRPEMKEAACQTDKECFECPCCRHNLS